MKKVILVLLVVLALSISVASPVFAGGDKVRGDKGEGDTNQEWINLQSPWAPEPEPEP